MLTDETIANIPVLVLGNKIDRPEAISEDALRGMFGLHGHTTGKVKDTKCFVKYNALPRILFYRVIQLSRIKNIFNVLFSGFCVIDT